MKKQGQRLDDILPKFQRELLEKLMNEFSISTAEEFVSAAVRSGETMRSYLHINVSEWNSLLRFARAVFSEEELHILETPVKSKFPKGAILDKQKSRTPEMEKYITRRL